MPWRTSTNSNTQRTNRKTASFGEVLDEALIGRDCGGSQDAVSFMDEDDDKVD